MKSSLESRDTKPRSAGRRRGRGTSAYVAAFRNTRGETRQPAPVRASEAKSEFGRVLETAIQGGAVVITRHDTPKAVLISIEDFNALAGSGEARLDTLDREFDALLAQMQAPGARRSMKAAFAAPGRELGRAAVAAARRRG